MPTTSLTRFLGRVDDTCQIEDRGCVVVPGIPTNASFNVSAGDAIRLKRPDGSEITTTIAGIALGGNIHSIPLLLQAITKDDVPIGTELFVADACKR